MTRLLKILVLLSAFLLIAQGAHFFMQRSGGARKEWDRHARARVREEMLRMPRSPYYHSVRKAVSKDGLKWEARGGVLFEHASVPGAVLRDGVLYVYFVDMSVWHSLSVAISRDGGDTFEVRPVTIEGQREGDAVDPHPELVDGKIRLYFLGDFLERLITAGRQEINTIYSAESQDGFVFRNQRAAYRAPRVSDPDVFQKGAEWRMLVSVGPRIQLLLSPDKGLTFREGRVLARDGGVCDTIETGGVFRTYYCREGIRSATGVDKGSFNPDPGTRLSGSGADLGSPSIVQLRDGMYLMFYASGRIDPGEDELSPGSAPP